VRRRLIERKSAFVNGINLFNLRRMPETSGHSHVSIAAGLGKNLHFRIDATEASVGGVGEREISVHEGVGGKSGTLFEGEAAMAEGEVIAEFNEQTSCVFGGVGMRHAVMQVDLNLSPAPMTVLGEHTEQPFIVLLGGIEISVNQRAAIVVAVAVQSRRRSCSGRGARFWPPSGTMEGSKWSARARIKCTGSRACGFSARQVADDRTFLA